MIRYPLDFDDLVERVSKRDAKWLKKAAARTKRFEKGKKYSEKSAIWSTVKPVFMWLQRDKCMFCEREFQNEAYGKIEFDLEHFRPKSSVKSWPVEGLHKARYDFQTGAESAAGYYWLSYDLGNYAVSCKNCNSSLKSNFFPIAGDRLTEKGELSLEQQFLCYALGDEDDDPEELIGFIGTVAVPTAADEHNRRRGQVIIDFFDLNGREGLHRQRAHMLTLLGSALKAIAEGHDEVADHGIVDRCMTDEVPHASCLRSFHRLWQSDQSFARRILTEAKEYFASASGTMPA